MIRIGVLLILLLIAPADAQPAAVAGLDLHVVASVYGAALAFMLPRTLDAVPASQLTIWGLRGLTALDADLTVAVRDGKLLLVTRDRVMAERTPPAENDVGGWANTAAEMAGLAWPVSAPERRAGTAGVVQSFFDELFNHLDPYSRYVAPSDASEDRGRRTGEGGVGLRLARHGLAIIVVEAIADGPGALAGIRPGDAILAVDGEPVRGKDVRSVADRLAGPQATTVTVTWRGRDGRAHTLELERAMVPPESVYSQRIGRVLLIQLTAFNRSTSMHFARATEDGLAGAGRPDGIVLDVRGNRGGLLRQAVAVADALLPAGVVTVTAGRDPEASEIWRSNTGELAQDMPVVVLVDGRTASAAEVLAAALGDRGRAVVVGSSTLGKGLVQTIDPLPYGGELFVTWSRILAPRGWPIQGLGVLPQVCTSLGRDELATELAALAAGQQPMARALAIHHAARAPIPPAQILAVRQTCPAAEGGDADLEAARALIRDPAAYAAALLPPLRDTRQLSVVGPQGTDH